MAERSGLDDWSDATLAIFWDLDSFPIPMRAGMLQRHPDLLTALAERGQHCQTSVYTSNGTSTAAQGRGRSAGRTPRMIECRTEEGIPTSADVVIATDVMQFLLDQSRDQQRRERVKKMVICLVVSRDRIYNYLYLMETLRRGSIRQSPRKVILVTTKTEGLTQASLSTHVLLDWDRDILSNLKTNGAGPNESPPAKNKRRKLFDVNSGRAADKGEIHDINGDDVSSMEDDDRDGDFNEEEEEADESSGGEEHTADRLARREERLLSQREINNLARFATEEFNIIWRFLESNGWTRSKVGYTNYFSGPGVGEKKPSSTKMMMTYLQNHDDWSKREDFLNTLQAYREAIKSGVSSGSPRGSRTRKVSRSKVIPGDTNEEQGLGTFTDEEVAELNFKGDAFAKFLWPSLQEHGWEKNGIWFSNLKSGEKNVRGVKNMIMISENKLGWAEEPWYQECVSGFKKDVKLHSAKKVQPTKRNASKTRSSTSLKPEPINPNKSRSSPKRRSTTKAISYEEVDDEPTDEEDLISIQSAPSEKKVKQAPTTSKLASGGERAPKRSKILEVETNEFPKPVQTSKSPISSDGPTKETPTTVDGETAELVKEDDDPAKRMVTKEPSASGDDVVAKERIVTGAGDPDIVS